MLLCFVLSYLLGKPPLRSTGSRADAFLVSQQQTKTDVCMTLAHLLSLIFLEFTVLFSSRFFLKYFCFPLSLFIFFPVIPKAVIFLVVTGIVVCGSADSVKPLKNGHFHITIFQEPESLYSLISLLCFPRRCLSMGPPFVCTGVAFTSQTS